MTDWTDLMGPSAGALAGALFGAGVSWATLRMKLRQASRDGAAAQAAVPRLAARVREVRLEAADAKRIALSAHGKVDDVRRLMEEVRLDLRGLQERFEMGMKLLPEAIAAAIKAALDGASPRA